MKATTTVCSVLRTKRIFRLASALFVLLLVSQATAQITVPLTIQEMTYPGVAGVARTSEPVTVGIPLAKGAVACGNANPASCTGLSSLGLSGASVGQFRCLAEWEDQSCKWVLVDTQTTLVAGGLSTSIVLTAGTGNFGGTNLATDNGTTITVDTGAAQFTVKKANFNVFDQVIVGGQTIVASGSSTGLAIVGPAAGGTSCGTCTTTYTSSNDASSTAVIEENGPVRAVIKADGAHKDASNNTYMRWTVRLFFYKGKSYVKANVSLRNADSNSSAYKGFSAYELRLSPSLGATRSFSFGNNTATPTAGSFTGTENAYLYQAYTNHMEHTDWASSTASFITRSGSTYAQNGFQITQGANTLARNSATSAASKMFGDLSDSTGAGILAGVYLGGEYWPKSVQFQNGGSEVRVGIWPDQTLYNGTCSLSPCTSPYYQAWPQHSIHDVYLNFHSSALASPQDEFLKQQFALVARATVDYYNSTNALFNALINSSEEDSYYRNLGMSCCIADFTPNVFRFYYWPSPGGGNQADFALAYLRNFLERGQTGRYLWAQNRYRFNAEQAFPRSDGFNWRTSGSSLDSWGFPTASSTNGNNANRAWVDQEHAHWYGMVDYYYVTGDETIHDAINDGPKDRFLNTTASLNTGNLWNERAIGNELIAIARMYQLAKGTNDPDAPGFLTVADKVLSTQVWPDLPNPVPGATGGQGTGMNRGFHYGCCASDTWPNPPAGSGPNGPGSARTNHVFMTSILVQGMYEIAVARGATWTDTKGADQYDHALDYAYGMAHWELTEGFWDDGTCAPVQNCGFVYAISPDYSQSLGPQIGQETIWYPFFIQQLYKGDTSWWQRKLNVQLKQVDQANSGGTWDENANYTVNQVIYSALHPGTLTLQDVAISVTNNGGGSYTITWTPPAGVTKYRLKHFNGKQIVDDLGWNATNNTSTFSQTSFNPFWSSPATRQQPTAGQSSVTVTLDDLTGAALASSGENFALKAYTTIQITVDTTPPTVAMSTPANNATVSGTVTVSANASDNVGVVGVQFQLDGANLGAEDLTAPYSVSWDTTTATNAGHSLKAIARDAAGNKTTSTAISVTVNNTTVDTTPPTVSLTAPANNATVSGTISVSANASDNVGVVGVQFKLDGLALGAEDLTLPYSVSWNTTTASNGAHTLTAVARDAASNQTTSAAVTVTVNNPDITLPTVSLTAPAANANVSGTITVSANASDNVGVVGVQFQLDGANLGAEDLTAPYSVSWDSTKATNGTHSLTAIARDAAGNHATATAVTVTVTNIVTNGGVTTVGVDANTQYSVQLKNLSSLITCPSCWFSKAADVMSAQTVEVRVRSGSNPAVADQVILQQGSVDATVVSVGANQFVAQPPSGTVWPASITVETGNMTAFTGFATATGPLQAGQKVSVRGLLFKNTPQGVLLVASTVQLRP